VAAALVLYTIHCVWEEKLSGILFAHITSSS